MLLTVPSGTGTIKMTVAVLSGSLDLHSSGQQLATVAVQGGRV